MIPPEAAAPENVTNPPVSAPCEVSVTVTRVSPLVVSNGAVLIVPVGAIGVMSEIVSSPVMAYSLR